MHDDAFSPPPLPPRVRGSSGANSHGTWERGGVRRESRSRSRSRSRERRNGRNRGADGGRRDRGGGNRSPPPPLTHFVSPPHNNSSLGGGGRNHVLRGSHARLSSRDRDLDWDRDWDLDWDLDWDGHRQTQGYAKYLNSKTLIHTPYILSLKPKLRTLNPEPADNP